MYEMKDFGGSLGRGRSAENLSTRSKASHSPAFYSPAIKRVFSDGNFRRAFMWKKEAGESKGEKVRHSHGSAGCFSSPPSPQASRRLNKSTSVGTTSQFVQYTNCGPTTSISLPCKAVYYMPHSYVVLPPMVLASSPVSDSAEKYIIDANTVSNASRPYAVDCQEIGRNTLKRCLSEGNKSSVWPVTHPCQQKGRRSFKQKEDLLFPGSAPFEPAVCPPSPPHCARYCTTRQDHSLSSYPLLQTMENQPKFGFVNENRPSLESIPSPYATYYPDRHENPELPSSFLHQSTNSAHRFVSSNENIRSIGYSYGTSYPYNRSGSPDLHYHSLQQALKMKSSCGSLSDIPSSASLFTTVCPETISPDFEKYYQCSQEQFESPTAFSSKNIINEGHQSQIDKSQQYVDITTKSSNSFTCPASVEQEDERFEFYHSPNQSLCSWSPSSVTPPVPVLQLSSNGSASDDSQSNTSSMPCSTCLCSQCVDGSCSPSPQKSPRKHWSLRKFLLDRMLASSPHSSMGSTVSLGSRGSIGHM